MSRSVPRIAVLVLLTMSASASSCERDDSAEDAPAAAAAAVDTPLATPGANADVNQPDEIYFDLTQYAWYREGRPLVHNGRGYTPMSDPTPVDVELREAGSYEGVTYYAAGAAREPVYTLYVPVYYRYWQRFTAPPGS